MIATALSLVLLMPRAKAGSAWAQTLVATLDAPATHTISRYEDGRVSLEEWRSGVKRATVLYTDDGGVQVEMRNDGKRSVNYFNWWKVAESRGERLGPNALRYALVSKDATERRRFYEIPLGDAKVVLSDPDIKVVGHEEASGDRPETYRLRQTVRLGGKPLGDPREVVAEIDPDTHRIRALIEAPRRFKGRVVRFRTEIDYPSALPEGVFAPRVRVAKVDATYDYNEGEKAVQRTLRQGLGKRGPVTLRAVLLDGEGELWAYWTGAAATRTFSLPGVALEAGGRRNAYPSGLTGLGRVPKNKIGRTIDLDVPYPGGVARFRGVPVRRIGLVNHVQGVLMAYRPSP